MRGHETTKLIDENIAIFCLCSGSIDKPVFFCLVIVWKEFSGHIFLEDTMQTNQLTAPAATDVPDPRALQPSLDKGGEETVTSDDLSPDSPEVEAVAFSLKESSNTTPLNASITFGFGAKDIIQDRLKPLVAPISFSASPSPQAPPPPSSDQTTVLLDQPLTPFVVICSPTDKTKQLLDKNRRRKRFRRILLAVVAAVFVAVAVVGVCTLWRPGH